MSETPQARSNPVDDARELPLWRRLLPIPAGLDPEVVAWLDAEAARRAGPDPEHHPARFLRAARAAQSLARLHWAGAAIARAADSGEPPDPRWLRVEAQAQRQLAAAEARLRRTARTGAVAHPTSQAPRPSPVASAPDPAPRHAVVPPSDERRATPATPAPSAPAATTHVAAAVVAPRPRHDPLPRDLAAAIDPVELRSLWRELGRVAAARGVPRAQRRERAASLAIIPAPRTATAPVG